MVGLAEQEEAAVPQAAPVQVPAALEPVVAVQEEAAVVEVPPAAWHSWEVVPR